MSEVLRLAGVCERAGYGDRAWSVCYVRRPVKRKVRQGWHTGGTRSQHARGKELDTEEDRMVVSAVPPGHWDCGGGAACDIWSLHEVQGRIILEGGGRLSHLCVEISRN